MSSTCCSVRDEQLAVLGAARRDREAAVARDHRSHAVVRRRRQRRIPEDLRVVVRVDVDEARRDDLTRRVELARRRSSRSPISVMHAVGDRDVGGASRRAGAVDDGAALESPRSVAIGVPRLLVGVPRSPSFVPRRWHLELHDAAAI